MMAQRYLAFALTLSTFCSVSVGCSARDDDPRGSHGVAVRRGNLAKSGGTPTVRRTYQEPVDDPRTTNDESNDHPLGHFGSTTLVVSSLESGNTYTLDVELDGFEVERIYFPKGGWVDFLGCELERDLMDECEDEQGRIWTFEGPARRTWNEPDIENEDEGSDDPGAEAAEP